MSRRVQKGKNKSTTKLQSMGLRQGRHGKKGVGGMRRDSSIATEPKGYRSSSGPSRQSAAKGREEAHPGHSMLAAGRRGKKWTPNFGTDTR